MSDFGNTTHDPSNSVCVSMTSESVINQNLIFNISSTPFLKNINSQLTELAQTTVA